MKTKIQTEVQLVLDDIILNVVLTEKLKKRDDRLINCGFIEFSGVKTGEKEIFWDNLDFFIDCSFEDFHLECGETLKNRFSPSVTFLTIKKLIKRAFKLKLLTKIKNK